MSETGTEILLTEAILPNEEPQIPPEEVET